MVKLINLLTACIQHNGNEVTPVQGKDAIGSE